jgi:hypothetical protein
MQTQYTTHKPATCQELGAAACKQAGVQQLIGIRGLLDGSLSQTNLVHALISYTFHIHYNIIFLPILKPPNWFPPSGPMN